MVGSIKFIQSIVLKQNIPIQTILPLNQSKLQQFMRALNYHTIDPLILQTLNLNERRMNHILDILHGRPGNSKPEPPKTKLNKHFFQNSLRQDKYVSNTSLLLPQISKRNLTIETDRSSKINDRKYSTLDKSKVRKSNSLHKNTIMSSSAKISEQLNLEPNAQSTQKNIKKHRSERKRMANESVTPIQYLKYSKIEQAKESSQLQAPKRQPRNSLSAVRNKLISSKASQLQSSLIKQLSPAKQQQVQKTLEQSLMPSSLLLNEKQSKNGYLNHRKKTKQLMNDYMGDYTLKKSKSMQVLNPKDIYRLEIENIVAELTPIEKLEDAEKKMIRIKRRHQHLKHFDQKYYSKLNQMDLITL